MALNVLGGLLFCLEKLIWLTYFLFIITGMYILAGFSDKLRIMNLLIDDIKTFREFHVRNCTACAFSCGGHLLAAVSHNQISVFSSVDFRNTVC